MSGEITTSLLVLAGLGAFHGLNPGMGWLFAVALGMQEGRRRAVWRALLPLAAGHALAIAGTVAIVRLIGLVAPPGWLGSLAGVTLVLLGVSRLVRHHHPRWVRMRVGLAGLTAWSFLMATAHGAGLMVLPFVLGGGASAASAASGVAVCHTAAAAAHAPGLLGVTVAHGSGYLLATALVAVVVFEKLGLGLLRRAWINLDMIWAAALVVTGLLTLLG